MTYSNDLRTKALDYIEKGGSKEEASQIFGITVRTLFNWIKRKKAGYLAPSKRKERTPHKIDSEKLKTYLEERPDAYLREISQFMGAPVTTVFYACKRLKFNLKKRHNSIENETRRKEKTFRRN